MCPVCNRRNRLSRLGGRQTKTSDVQGHAARPLCPIRRVPSTIERTRKAPFPTSVPAIDIVAEKTFGNEGNEHWPITSTPPKKGRGSLTPHVPLALRSSKQPSVTSLLPKAPGPAPSLTPAS
jgi:hypothetical protein